MCMVNCPFGAISDKSQIFQLAHALKKGDKVIAEIAPAYAGQFGDNITPRNLKAALQELGFEGFYEVALGADIGAVAEAHHYVNKVTTGELPFLLTSCCPSWAMLAKKYFPDLIEEVSQELTPMVATARTIKQQHPDSKVVFIGPCAAKKLEQCGVLCEVTWILSLPLKNCRLCLTPRESTWRNMRQSPRSTMQQVQAVAMP